MSMMEGKAWALPHAMKEANHRGLDMVQFESDSHGLSEAIRIRHNGIMKNCNLYILFDV
jgi:hypothetical protein